MMESSFIERLVQVDHENFPEGKALQIFDDIISCSEWDPFQAGKYFGPAEVICHFVAAICGLIKKRRVNSFLSFLSIISF